jgi:asparagine synthase (glutamine-hydrolysing)
MLDGFDRETLRGQQIMSVQFGRCNFDGKPVDSKDLEGARSALTPYGPDGEGCICKDNFGVLFRAFHTTKEDRVDRQPHVSQSGAVTIWDGRLDNRDELIHELAGELSTDSTDVSIVSAAYERWGTGSFCKLIGDWAVCTWDPRTQALVLAKDFLGSRHLYYSIENDTITWCTILDPLVHFADRSLVLEEEFIAGWLSFFPAPDLTPYVGLQAVPPSCFVRFSKGTRQVNKYWDFNPAKKIRYPLDADYEEHFRSVFAQSIRRRLRSDTPVLAELSGGMDSSSIVCMADNIIRDGFAETPRLDTLSYYDDSEPNWNERPFFTKVEEKRGRVGCHIDVSNQSILIPHGDRSRVALTPSSPDGRTTESSRQLAACMGAQGTRVVLSGVGGDEITGGVPTPMPELEDLLARAQFWSLAHGLKVWALNKRKPWLHLFWAAIEGFCPSWRLPKDRRTAPWLNSDFVKRNNFALRGYRSRVKLFGPLPSFQENIFVLNALRRQFGCVSLPLDPPYERRHPYLDRDLLEFMFSIPREQVVRPGQRRSLMRRALAGTVPEEILNRKRKAFVTRSPVTALAAELPKLLEDGREMHASSFGIVDSRRFSEVLAQARQGVQVPLVTVMRTVALEDWLRGLADRHLLQAGSTSREKHVAHMPEGRGEVTSIPQSAA